MEGTLKLFKQLVTKETETMSIEDMAKQYQINLNPQYLATSFVKLYGLIIVESKKFFNLNSADIASFSVEKLDVCLQKYDISQKTKFSTYYKTALYNKFREETEALSMQKRKTMFNTCSIHENKGVYEQVFDNIEYGLPNNLTKTEQKYCRFLSQGYTIKQISKIMEISTVTLYSYKKRLKTKFELMNL